MGNKDKTRDGDATADRDHSHSRANRDHSRDREAARDAALAKTIAEAVAQQTQSIAEMFAKQNREAAKEIQSITEMFAQQNKRTKAFTRQMEKAHAQYQDLLKESHAATLPTTLKVTSSTDGFRVMDPFDWTLDKNVYQRWQLWSHKARLALEAMEGDTEKTKISYLHHWLNGEGISKIEGWKNSKILICQEEYDKLANKTGKYSLDKIESYFSLCELILTPRSNPLLAVEDLYLAKKDSMTSGEFHSHILKIVKRCQFPNQEAEERAVRDAIFMGMNSQQARDKAINLMNEEGKEVTVEFLMNHLAVEDGNTQHKFLSQINSSSSVNMIAYDRRQNRGKSNKPKQPNGGNEAQNKSRVQTSSSTAQPSRKPPGMEGKCMRCGKPEHQQGQKCAAKNAKCKECHKIGHFYKVCQSKKRDKKEANLAQATLQAEQDTYIDENGIRQPNPPMVKMLKIVNHIGTTSGSQEKHLKFPIDVNPRGPYKDHLVVRVDTGADVNCMNEKTFRRLFPKVKLSVCPYEIQNFGNSIADISILGQFRTYLQFRGEKYLNTFIVTNTDDCPNLLSHGATFRMGVLLPNYPEENVVKGENVPNFKISTSTGSSNVFQILQDLHLKQYQKTSSSQTRTSRTSTTDMTCTTTQPTPLMTYGSAPANQNTGMATPIISMSESSTSSRTTMPAETTPSSRQPTSEIHRNMSCNGLSQCCMHVHQPTSQVCKPGESLALRKVKTPHNGKPSMSRFPLTKQDILSQYSGCFEGIGRFPGDLCKFYLKPDHQPAKHASKKQGISEEVNEHTDWVHSNIFVEKALEREPYYTHSTREITTEFPNRERVEHARHFPTPMEMCMDDHLTQTTERTQRQHLQDKTSEQSCPTHSIIPDFTFRYAEFPPGMESTPFFLGKQFLQGKEESMDKGTFTLGNIILNRYPAFSTLTHQATEPGRVQQNFQQLEMESSDMEALPCFNSNTEANPQMETSRKGPGADSIQNGKGTTVTSSRVTPMDPVDDIQPPTRKSTSTINVHSQDSHSSKTD